MKRPAIAALMLLAVPAWGMWGIFYPARTAGEKLPRAYITETRPADPNDGGEVVEIDGLPYDLSAPLTYDRAARLAVADEAEIVRRSAQAAIDGQDTATLLSRVAAEIADLTDAIAAEQSFQALGPTPSAGQIRDYLVAQSPRRERAYRALRLLLRLAARDRGAHGIGTEP